MRMRVLRRLLFNSPVAALLVGGLVLGLWGHVLAVRATPAARALERPPVQWIGSPNFDDRPPGTHIDTIIIHDTESPGVTQAAKIAKFFADPHSQVSAHYIIGKAGEIVQCVDEGKAAHHAGPSLFRGRDHVNEFSIGIELVNSQSGHDPFPDAQYQSLGRLVAYLVARYDIPLDRIVGHHDITNRPSVKRDPAENFDWERFLTAVRADLDSPPRTAATK